MPRYTYMQTKEDYKKLLDELTVMNDEHKLDLDFKKLKRLQYDSLFTVHGLLKQRINKQHA